MTISKKMKWTLSLIGLTTMSIIPMSIALVSCSRDNNENLLDDKFIDNIQDENIPNEGADLDIYNKAKFISQNYSNKYSNIVSNAKVSNIALDWLNNATQKQIEDLLFINFNRNPENFSNYIKEGITYIEKAIFEIKDVNYNNDDHIVSFKFIAYFDAYGSGEKYYDVQLSSMYKTYFEYTVKNMKLIPNLDSKIPSLSFDTTNITVQLTKINYLTNIKQIWDNYFKVLNIAKERGDSYEGYKVEGDYYNLLKKYLESFKNIYYNFDKNANSNIGYMWDKNKFNVEISNNLLESIFEEDVGCGFGITIDGDGDGTIVDDCILNRSSFAIVEYNSDKSDFNFINN